MWDLQGILLYKSIEHRNERRTQPALIPDDVLVPYAPLLRDPRIDPEAAKKSAA